MWGGRPMCSGEYDDIKNEGGAGGKTLPGVCPLQCAKLYEIIGIYKPPDEPFGLHGVYYDSFGNLMEREEGLPSVDWS